MVPRPVRDGTNRQPRIGHPPRLLIAAQPLGWTQLRVTKDQLAGDEREGGGDRDVEDTARRPRDDPRDARAHEEQKHAEPADRAARDRLEQDIGPARQKERREEVPVQPALVRQKGHAEERAPEERYRNPDSAARGLVLGGAVATRKGHH